MSTLESKLVTPCHFRADGVFCQGGFLFYSQAELQDGVEYYRPVKVEKENVTCSVCDGRGVLLTEQGKDLLLFFDTFLRPKIHETCADYIDDKMGFQT